MLVIKIELWPFGDEKKKSVIAQAVVANVGGTAELGNYEVYEGLSHPKELTKLEHDAEVLAHERLNAPVFSLIRKALSALGY